MVDVQHDGGAERSSVLFSDLDVDSAYYREDGALVIPHLGSGVTIIDTSTTRWGARLAGGYMRLKAYRAARKAGEIPTLSLKDLGCDSAGRSLDCFRHSVLAVMGDI